MFTDRLCFAVSTFHPWAAKGVDISSTLAAQQFIIYAKATDTHRMIEEWMEKMAGKIRSPRVIGDMQAIMQMAKLGTAVGIVASWVAARDVEDPVRSFIGSGAFSTPTSANPASWRNHSSASAKWPLQTWLTEHRMWA
jgi:DNA-binding transcriptional LysR family regulator